MKMQLRDLRLTSFIAQGTMAITKEQIEKRAYELYLASGREEGKALNHWLEAKLELILESLETRWTSNESNGKKTDRRNGIT